METLIEILYLISTALLVPVIVVLLGFLIWCLLEVGGFLREWQERRAAAANWRSFVTRLDATSGDASTAAVFFDVATFPGFVGAFARRGRQHFQQVIFRGKLSADLEIEAAGRLATMNLGVRVGPMLGLMGTLIPLGPALLGLSEENIDLMGRSLVVAFCTTVLGLLIGGLCYAMLVVRRQWYAQDLADVEFVDQLLSHSGPTCNEESHHAPRDRNETQSNSHPATDAHGR
jgi:biopolymer transport protein ExbB/TolQ